jgi:hypothetical protein
MVALWRPFLHGQWNPQLPSVSPAADCGGRWSCKEQFRRVWRNPVPGDGASGDDADSKEYSPMSQNAVELERAPLLMNVSYGDAV